jgi:hypothetical protein
MGVHIKLHIYSTRKIQWGECGAFEEAFVLGIIYVK